MINLKNYKEMDCPVCGKTHFSKLSEDDISYEPYAQCRQCGWINDLEQTQNPDLEEGLNPMSLKRYRKVYRQKIKNNPNYNYQQAHFNPHQHPCPVCGKYVFNDISSFDICPYCGWEDDELMEAEPDKWAGCTNDLCLNDYRKRY